MNKLKPCPFCGNTNIFLGTILRANDYHSLGDDKYDMTHYLAVCNYVEGGCGGSTGRSYETALEAAAAWNQRVEKGN